MMFMRDIVQYYLHVSKITRDIVQYYLHVSKTTGQTYTGLQRRYTLRYWFESTRKSNESSNRLRARRACAILRRSVITTKLSLNVVKAFLR